MAKICIGNTTISDTKAASAHPGLSVINNVDAAYERFNLTKQGGNANGVLQGFAHDPYKNELYTLHVSGASSSVEGSIINKFVGNGPRNITSTRYTNTPSTGIGHQELDIGWDENGDRWFFTSESVRFRHNIDYSNYPAEPTTASDIIGTTDAEGRYIKRFKVSDSSTNDLSITEEQQIQVFTNTEVVDAANADNEITATEANATSLGVEVGDEVTNPFGVSHQIVTACISLDGKWLIVEKTEGSSAGTSTIKVFDAFAVMKAANDAGSGVDVDVSSTHKYKWSIPNNFGSGEPLQSMVSDGAYVFIFSGNFEGSTEGSANNATGIKCNVYTISGDLIKEFDDFKIGRAEAATVISGVSSGKKYELEGAGWIWYNGQPFLSVNTVAGDLGSRVNRIWMLGGNVIASAQETGEWTPIISDTDGGSGGNTDTPTPVAGSNTYVRMGNMVFIQLNLEDIDVGNLNDTQPNGQPSNLYIRGLPYTPAHRTPLGAVLTNNFEFVGDGTDRTLFAEAETDGHIQFLEVNDGNQKTTANVIQLDSVDIRFAGWYRI